MNGKRECMPTKPDLKGAVRREQEELLALHHVLGDHWSLTASKLLGTGPSAKRSPTQPGSCTQARLELGAAEGGGLVGLGASA